MRQGLYRLAWFADCAGDYTKELGFVLANGDEEAMDQIPKHLEAGSYGDGIAWNEEAFFTAELVDDPDRLADLLEWSLEGVVETNITRLTFKVMAEAMLKSI